MQNIGIYCSASSHINPKFSDAAQELGYWMGKNKKTLVNGGSSQGLMEVFSKTVKEYGGHCIGVIPEGFASKGWHSPYSDEKIIVKDLSERKEVIKKISDVLITFPGGIGTLDEFFDAWASFTLGFHDKKIILINLDGFFDSLLEQIRVFEQEKFLHDFQPNPIIVLKTVEECISALRKLDPIE